MKAANKQDGKCNFCGMLVANNQHHLRQCSKANTPNRCAFCGEEVPLRRLAGHRRGCQKRGLTVEIVKCDLCKSNVSKGLYDDHVKNKCRMTLPPSERKGTPKARKSTASSRKSLVASSLTGKPNLVNHKGPIAKATTYAMKPTDKASALSMETCSFCGVKVRSDRLGQHVRRVHVGSPNEAAKRKNRASDRACRDVGYVHTRCRHCDAIAIPGSDTCYACNPK